MPTRCRLIGARRGGGILFEVLLAVALFAGAAAFSLGCVKSVFTALDQTRREQQAVDLARSKMAELQAGLITLADLRGESIDAVGTASAGASANAAGASGSSGGVRGRWVVDVKTHRSEFTGLSLVELTVREDTASAGVNEDDAMSFTLRQLMPLRRGDAEEEYQADDLTKGLSKDKPAPPTTRSAPRSGK